MATWHSALFIMPEWVSWWMTMNDVQPCCWRDWFSLPNSPPHSSYLVPLFSVSSYFFICFYHLLSFCCYCALFAFVLQLCCNKITPLFFSLHSLGKNDSIKHYNFIQGLFEFSEFKGNVWNSKNMICPSRREEKEFFQNIPFPKHFHLFLDIFFQCVHF